MIEGVSNCPFWMRPSKLNNRMTIKPIAHIIGPRNVHFGNVGSTLGKHH